MNKSVENPGNFIFESIKTATRNQAGWWNLWMRTHKNFMITFILSILSQQRLLKNPLYVLIALIQLEVYEFGWFSKIIMCQTSHMSILTTHSSKAISSFWLLSNCPTVHLGVRLRNYKSFMTERRNLHQKVLYQTRGSKWYRWAFSPPASYSRPLPTPFCQTFKVLTRFYFPKVFKWLLHASTCATFLLYSELAISLAHAI